MQSIDFFFLCMLFIVSNSQTLQNVTFCGLFREQNCSNTSATVCGYQRDCFARIFTSVNIDCTCKTFQNECVACRSHNVLFTTNGPCPNNGTNSTATSNATSVNSTTNVTIPSPPSPPSPPPPPPSTNSTPSLTSLIGFVQCPTRGVLCDLIPDPICGRLRDSDCSTPPCLSNYYNSCLACNDNRVVDIRPGICPVFVQCLAQRPTQCGNFTNPVCGKFANGTLSNFNNECIACSFSMIQSFSQGIC